MSSRRLKKNVQPIIGESQSVAPPQAEFDTLNLTSTKYPPTVPLERQDKNSEPLIRKEKKHVQPKTTTSTDWKHYPKTYSLDHTTDCPICGGDDIECYTRTGPEGWRCRRWPRFLDELLFLANDTQRPLIYKFFNKGFVKPWSHQRMSLIEYMGYLSVVENPLVFEDQKDIPFILEDDDYRKWTNCLSKSFSAFRWLLSQDGEGGLSSLHLQPTLMKKIERLINIPICIQCFQIQIGPKQHYYEHFGDDVYEPVKQWVESVLNTFIIRVGDTVHFKDTRQPYEDSEGEVTQMNQNETQAKVKRMGDERVTRWINLTDLRKSTLTHTSWRHGLSQ